MISSLRRKVFWSILLSAAGVLLVILLAFNILRIQQTGATRESILDSARMMLQPEDGFEWDDFDPDDPDQVDFDPDNLDEDDFAPGDFRPKPGGLYEDDRDRFDFLRSVSEGELGVLVRDSDGAIIAQAGCASELDETTITAISEAALTDADGHGSAAGWDYKTFPHEEGLIVSFLDSATLRRENMETALLSLAAFALACFLFALLARFLSRSIVKPVEENMQMQKRFVADASHELKTPLAVISANASVLEQSIGQNKWLGYITEQTERMSALVNELLQLANLEEAKDTKGSDAPQLAQYDAAEAVMTAALPFESMAFERGVMLETDTPDQLDVYGNRKDLEQLAAILIDNAVKHSEPGSSVQVSLSTIVQRSGWKEEPVLKLSVANSGDEIPPDALPHLFDRFYRADASRVHKDNSYGLGLAIAKELAEKNKGSITVTSQNRSTEFSLLLPGGRQQ